MSVSTPSQDHEVGAVRDAARRDGRGYTRGLHRRPRLTAHDRGSENPPQLAANENTSVKVTEQAGHHRAGMDWNALATYTSRSRTSRRGAATRDRIIQTAADLFASRGVEAVTLSEILERAGQANESAIQYHFGSREGLVVAILRSRSDGAEARHEFLRELEARGDAISLEEAAAALVIPLRQAMKTKWDRDYIRLAAQVIRHLPNQDRMRPEDPATRRALELIEERLVDLPLDIRHERLGAATTIASELWAVRAEEIESGVASNLDDETFERNLLAMILGMLTAPVR